MDQTYDENPPVAALAGLVRTVWIQHTGSQWYLQHDLPTGGVELQCPIGGVPRLVGPLTRARVQFLPPHKTIVGVRFMPGAGTPLLGVPADELVDLVVDLWGPAAEVIGSLTASADAVTALGRVQQYLAARDLRPDPLVAEMVRRLMPWRPTEISMLASAANACGSRVSRRANCSATRRTGATAVTTTRRRTDRSWPDGTTHDLFKRRGGGHCFAGRSSTAGLLLDLSPLNTISVNGDGLATIGPGARLAHIYEELHRHELTIPAGCGPTVGIAGLTLGGGLGLLGRRYGLTCDRLVGATVVLADGSVVTCDEQRDADLFWALRGAGGGQFGVVTSLVFAAVPSPSARRFELTWPRERFLLEHVSPDPDRARRSWATAHPHGSGHAYPNFPDPDLASPEPYHGANLARLITVKHHYDPNHFFDFPGAVR